MTVNSDMIKMARLAGRITTTAYDPQVILLLEAAMEDLGVAGVEVPEACSALVTQAAITYFRMHFGQPDDYERLKASYDEQKAQLVTATGYTDWGDIDGQI